MDKDEKLEELEAKLEELAGAQGFSTGKALYEDGAVLDILRDSRGIDTRVANDAGRFEKVRIALKKNYFSAKCSCPARGFAICEHSVAAFLQFYEEYPEAVPFPLATPNTQTKTRPAEEPTKTKETSTPTAGGNAAIQQISFKDLLQNLEEVRGMLVLNYKGKGYPEGESRWNSSPFQVELHFGDKVYSGSNIKRLVETGSAAAGMRFEHFSPQDQQIMRYFSNHGELSGSNFVLNALDMGALFHCLIGFQRFYANNTKINVSKSIAELVLMITNLDEGIQIEPRLKVEDYGLIPTQDVSVITARSGFWLGYKGMYWWTPGVSGAAWLHSFLHGEPVVLPEENYTKLREQCTREVLPVSIINKEDDTETEISSGKFTPVLSIDWQRKSLVARLEFSYSGIRTSLNSEKMIWTGKEYIARDEVGEEKVIKKLQRMGFLQLSDAPDAFRMQSLERIGDFLDNKLPKLSEDWEIYCSTEFERRRQLSGLMNVNVKTLEENNDWFQLQYEFFTKPGSTANWDAVVNAILQGHNYVRLESGGVARISEQIKEAVQSNLDNSIENSDDGKLKFSHYSAVYVGNQLDAFASLDKSTWSKLYKSVMKRKKKPLVMKNHLDDILRDYQKDGVTWLNMIEHSGFHGILADEMGLGKTLQTLSCIYHSHTSGKGKKPASLIICPTSLVHNWKAEAEKFIPDFKVGVIYGNNRQEVIDNLNDYDLVLTSYALVRRDIDQYRDYNFHYVALDEAQHIKNSGTANARTCKEIRSNHRLILTGTPIENSVREIWSLFDFVMPGYLGTAKDFQEKFERKSQEERAIATQQLADKIRPFMLRRRKLDVCDELPPKIEQIIYCDLSDEQRALYNQIMSEAKQMLERMKSDGVQKHRLEMLSVLLRLRQLCCHPRLLPTELSPDLQEMPSAKTELFKELVMESIDSNHRMLVFSQFTSLLAELRSWLEEEGIRYEYLDGSTQNRMDCVNRFNEDEGIPVFLLSLKAGGTGLNLTGADTVIHYDQWWNPMVEDQATDRSHRIGQTKQVVALKLVTKNTVEEKIVKLQESKRELFNQVMAGVPTNMNELTEEDFEFLLTEGL